MADGLLYREPQRYPAVVTDRWGRFETTLVNDGQDFVLLLRGNRFESRSVGGFELVGSPLDGSEPPDLYESDLCSCVIEWRMPVRVAFPNAGPAEMDLDARLALGDPLPRRGFRVDVVLTLRLPTGDVENAKPHEGHEDMEQALLDLQRQLPAGVRILACISCAFSDYHPAGWGFIGTMACFRGAKDAYRPVETKRALFQVWDQRSGFVQETFFCADYEPRRPGAGYRGWPSFP